MGASTDIERSDRAGVIRLPCVPSGQAMEEQLRPMAHKGGQCAPESDTLESRM